MFLSMVNVVFVLLIFDLLFCVILFVNYIFKLDKGFNVFDGFNCDW